MRVTLVFGSRTDRQVWVYRPNRDRFSPQYGDRRQHLAVGVPDGMGPVAILTAALPQLDEDEARALAEVLGLRLEDVPPETP
jgi:hypothetical protein